MWPSPANRPDVGIEADPAGAGQIDLGPRVQVGEVLRRARRAVERLHVGLRAGSDSRRRSARRARGGAAISTSSQAESRHEPLARLERLLARLHARLHADQVAESRCCSRWFSATRKSMVLVAVRSIDASQARADAGPAGSSAEIRRQLAPLRARRTRTETARRAARGRNRTD